MLPSYIDASTFAETLRKQQQPIISFGNEDKFLILDSYSNQSDNLGCQPYATHSSTSPHSNFSRSFDSVTTYSPYSAHMSSESTQDEIEKVSRRVSDNSWLTFAPSPLVEPSLFSDRQFAMPAAIRHPRPLSPPGASLGRPLSKGTGNSSTTPLADSFVSAALPDDWIDLEPTPLPSSFSTKRKNESVSNVDILEHKQSRILSTPKNENWVNASSSQDATFSAPRVSDEPSIVSMSDSGRATPTIPDLDSGSSLLHESCRLYPTTRAVVESALRLNPSCIRQRRNPPKMSPQFGKELTTSTRASASPYPTGCTLPLNIALENGASLDVVKLLVEEYPDVILAEDGPQACGSLSVALYHSTSNDIVLTLILAKPDSVKMVDRRHSNLPLHVACAKGASFDVIHTLVQLYPKALHHRNFHGQTPLDICQRHSSVCSDRVTDFLQEATFRNASTDLETILDDALDVES